MTKIINGYAQADIWATKDDEERCIFVETPSSLKGNALALKKSFIWLKENKPNVKVDFYVTKPRRK